LLCAGLQGLDSLMYSSFDLHCPTRKVAQAYFLFQKVRWKELLGLTPPQVTGCVAVGLPAP